MRLTVNLPWLTYSRRLMVAVVAALLLLAAALPASGAPPQGVSGQVEVTNDETNPVPVTVQNPSAQPVSDVAHSASYIIGEGMTATLTPAPTHLTAITVSVDASPVVTEVVIRIDLAQGGRFRFVVLPGEDISQVFPTPLYEVESVDIFCDADTSHSCNLDIAVAGF